MLAPAPRGYAPSRQTPAGKRYRIVWWVDHGLPHAPRHDGTITYQVWDSVTARILDWKTTDATQARMQAREWERLWEDEQRAAEDAAHSKEVG